MAGLGGGADCLVSAIWAESGRFRWPARSVLWWAASSQPQVKRGKLGYADRAPMLGLRAMTSPSA